MTCVLDRLDVSTRALKRAQYEAFDFRLTDSGVRVRNGSHANPDEHVYDVTVTAGVPSACTCPADDHYETACKHRLAVAIREPVLNAAIANAAPANSRTQYVSPDDGRGGQQGPITDGGGVTDTSSDETDIADSDRPTDCECPDDPDGFPCWPCVRDGYRTLPDEDAAHETERDDSTNRGNQ